MKSWLRNDSVYQSIMSGALLIVFLAALSASYWPQLTVVAGLITTVVVGIVAVVYWAAVVCGDAGRANPERQPDVSVKQETEREQKPVAGTLRVPLQKQEIFEEYAAILKRFRDTPVAVSTLEQDAFVRMTMRQVLLKGMNTEWAASREEWLRYSETSQVLRNWLVHQPHHGAHLTAGASLKSHRRAYAAARRLASITAGEDETGEKVVVTVGSVRIEIQEDDPNKTTTVHITSPETIVTKVAVQDARGDHPKPEPVSQSKPSATIH